MDACIILYAHDRWQSFYRFVDFHLHEYQYYPHNSYARRYTVYVTYVWIVTHYNEPAHVDSEIYVKCVYGHLLLLLLLHQTVAIIQINHRQNKIWNALKCINQNHKTLFHVYFFVHLSHADDLWVRSEILTFECVCLFVYYVYEMIELSFWRMSAIHHIWASFE